MRASSLTTVLFAVLLIGVLGARPGAAQAPSDPLIDVVTVGLPSGAAADMRDEIRNHAQDVYPALAARLGTTPRPLRVTLSPEIEGTRDVMHLPPWAAGGARADRGEIVLAVHNEGQRHDRLRVLTHELAHVAVFDAAGGNAVPRWLNEGIARTVAGEFGADDHRRLAEAKTSGRFLPLDGLVRAFPAPERDASLAYAQSGRAVRELISLGGEHGLATVLRHIAKGETADNALFATYGLRTYQLQKEVERSVSWASALGAMTFDKDIVLAVFALMLALSSSLVFRRRRARFDALAAREAAEAAAFAARGVFVLPPPQGPYCPRPVFLRRIGPAYRGTWSSLA